jgi:hypothetical protein
LEYGTCFLKVNLKERDNFQHGGTDRIILKWILKQTGNYNVDRVELAHNKVKSGAFVN